MCDKKEKQLELDKRYLRMAAVWAENSYCKRRQVGALIVKDQMIILTDITVRHPVSKNVCEDEHNDHQTLRSACGSQCHYESGRFVQQQQRCNDLRHLCPLHRMCQAHHPVWDQAGGIL